MALFLLLLEYYFDQACPLLTASEFQAISYGLASNATRPIMTRATPTWHASKAICVCATWPWCRSDIGKPTVRALANVSMRSGRNGGAAKLETAPMFVLGGGEGRGEFCGKSLQPQVSYDIPCLKKCVTLLSLTIDNLIFALVKCHTHFFQTCTNHQSR